MENSLPNSRKADLHGEYNLCFFFFDFDMKIVIGYIFFAGTIGKQLFVLVNRIVTQGKYI